MTEKRLGAILVKYHLVTQGQLIQALQKQRQQTESTGWQMLGQILVESGWLTSQDLADALNKQAQFYRVESLRIQTHPSATCRLKRSLDLGVAMVGLLVMLVLLPIIAIAIRIDSVGPIFVWQRLIGFQGKTFKRWRFRTTFSVWDSQNHCCPGDDKTFDGSKALRVTQVGKILRRFYLDEMPQFWNVLRGEMSLVGTHPTTPDAVTFSRCQDWQRFSVKPGMTGPWQIYRYRHFPHLPNIAQLDYLYIRRWSNRLDLKILVRTTLYILTGATFIPGKSQSGSNPNQVNILNVAIDNLPIQELLAQLDEGFVVTPNVDHLIKLQKDAEFYRIYTIADYRLCDSQILLYASRFLGTPLRQRISGSDFFPAFCQFHQGNQNIRIFLLGGASGVADRARRRINQKIGREIIIGSHSPSFGFEHNDQECLEIVDLINRSGATVLAVGVGAPKQEKWIAQYKDQMPNVKIFMAIGATIDFEAGVIKRAPAWMSHLGMEWLFRIAHDPKRLWKRYLVDDMPFFWLLLKQKMGCYTAPFSSPLKQTTATLVTQPVPPKASAIATVPINPKETQD